MARIEPQETPVFWGRGPHDAGGEREVKDAEGNLDRLCFPVQGKKNITKK